MQDLGIVDVSMRHFVGPVHIWVWEPSDPFPILGPTVGVDTETELITDTVKDPPVVVTGVFDPTYSNCWIVYWQHTAAFMRELNKRDIQQRYFNVGFDEQVLDNEDEEKSLLTAVDARRVRDMQIRIHLHEIATLGWIRGNLYNLADCALHFLNVTLDKGDPDDYENSARMTFRRHNKDGSVYRITDEQAKYLCYDCASTWGLGESVPEQPTEVEHTKGMIVLAHISTNGIQVDPVVFDAMEEKLFKARDEARLRLLAFGFPDPYKDAKKEAAAERQLFYSEYKKLCESAGLECRLDMVEQTLDDEDETVIQVPKIPSKDSLRLMICYLYNHSDAPDELQLCAENVKIVCEMEKPSLRKDARNMYSKLLEDYEIMAFDQATKGIVMPSFVAHLMEHYNRQRDSGEAAVKGYDFGAAVQYASEYIDIHPEWFSKAEQIGPNKFFQNHVKGIMEANPKLELETTPKSGAVKLTLKDKWRLEDNGIKDKFLDAYIDYSHCQKYLSTYMNRLFIKADNRIHARFTNILRTGRTSCTGPNLQNYPSRDKVFPLKNIFCPYDGMLLCATDFSFIESTRPNSKKVNCWNPYRVMPKAISSRSTGTLNPAQRWACTGEKVQRLSRMGVGLKRGPSALDLETDRMI